MKECWMKTHCLLKQCCEEYIVSNGSLNSFIFLKPICWQCPVGSNWPHSPCKASHLHSHMLRAFQPKCSPWPLLQWCHRSACPGHVPRLSYFLHWCQTCLISFSWPMLAGLAAAISVSCLPPAMVRWQTSCADSGTPYCWAFWICLGRQAMKAEYLHILAKENGSEEIKIW